MKKAGRRRFTANMMLLFASLLISLFCAELLIRQVHPIDEGKSFHFRIPHEIFGWVLKPNTTYSNRVDGNIIRVRYNSQGWRDTEHRLEKQGSKVRILILGDSFMEAYSVDLANALPKQLEQFGKKEGIELEVINLGVGGYGTLQEYLIFREVGQQYKPDIVLLGFYVSNDVRNNSFPLETKIEKGSMKADSRPFLTSSDMSEWHITQVDFDAAHRRYLSAMEDQNTWTKKLEDDSVLLKIIFKEIRYLIKNYHKLPGLQSMNQPSEDQERGVQEAFMMALNGVNYCHEPPDYTKAWNITQNILNSMNQDIVEMGGRLFVFSTPAFNEVDVVEMEKAIKETNGKLCLEDPPGYRRLAETLNKLNIDYVNLLPSFRHVTKNDKSILFRRSDKHWNEQGHRLAAKELFDALMKRKALINDLKTKRL